MLFMEYFRNIFMQLFTFDDGVSDANYGVISRYVGSTSSAIAETFLTANGKIILIVYGHVSRVIEVIVAIVYGHISIHIYEL